MTEKSEMNLTLVLIRAFLILVELVGEHRVGHLSGVGPKPKRMPAVRAPLVANEVGQSRSTYPFPVL